MADAITSATSGSNAIPTANTALQQKLWSVAEPSLLSNTVLWSLGTPLIMLPGQGLVAHIPTYDATAANAVTAAALGDSSATVTTRDLRALKFGARTIQLRKYVDFFGIEDMFAVSATIRDYLERGALFLNQGLAQRLSTYAQLGDAVAGVGLLEEDADATDSAVMWVQPNADGSAFGTVAAGDNVLPEGFFLARKKLRKKNAQGFAKLGNKYAAIIGPETSYMLQTNAAANTLTFRADTMNMPQIYKDAMIHSFAQMVFLETTFDVFEQGDVTAALEYGMADAVTDSEVNLILAADAFYTTEISSMPAGFILKGFGNGSAINDPANEWASLTIKAFPGFVAGDRASKVVQMPVPLA